MSTNAVGWVGWSAAAMLVVSRGLAAGEPWRAVEQPGLKQSLEQAPVLRVESLGEPSRGVNPWEHDLVPNPDGQTWDVLQWYMEYGPGGAQQLYIIDLGTGEVKVQSFPPNTPIYTAGRALGFDGKYYIVTLNRKPYSLSLYVYNPATNTMEDQGQVVGWSGGELRPIALGPDGRIYGTGLCDDGKVGLYIYDPKLRKTVKDFGPVGPRHVIGSTISREIGVDDTHAYIVSGDIPCYLVAINLETGEEGVLFETPHLLTKSGVRMYVGQSFPGARAVVPQGEGPAYKEYWLYHGEALAKVNDTPPWPKLASPWDKAGPKPELYYDQLEPDDEGNATLWYRLSSCFDKKFRVGVKTRQRLPEDAAKATKEPPADARAEHLGWRSVSLKGVESYSCRLGPLALLPDGRLYGAGEYYLGSFVFDPRTDKATLLGRNQGLSGYTNITHGDKLYSSGYPAGPLFVFEPQRPWTAYHGGPPGHPAPSRYEPASNPRCLGAFEGSTRVAISHSSAAGADGKLYFGGFGVRHYTGGGFGWYDPNTGEIDGFWKPLSGYAVYWIAPAFGGRLMVISTRPAPDELNENRVPEEAKLFFYDVEQGKIMKELVPVKKARTTGLITEVAPGRLLGLTTDTVGPEHPSVGVLYSVDVATGEVLFRKALPWPVGTDPYWPHWVDPSFDYLDLTHGPDGFVWTYLKDVLVRIDPKDASVHVVGRLEPPGRPIFVGNDLYFAGLQQLRRVRNMVPAP